MANMGYCRFRNTLADLRDCNHNMDSIDRENGLSKEEESARRQLIELCCEIASSYGDEIGAEVGIDMSNVQ